MTVFTMETDALRPITASPAVRSIKIRWQRSTAPPVRPKGTLTPNPVGKKGRPASLKQLKHWFKENHGEILRRAEINCQKLTGHTHL